MRSLLAMLILPLVVAGCSGDPDPLVEASDTLPSEVSQAPSTAADATPEASATTTPSASDQTPTEVAPSGPNVPAEPAATATEVVPDVG
ncbi:MAG: hypothetical protein ACR2HR_06875 [Euzebya sp.]